MLEEKNPWTLISNETVYENDWIKVEHHEVLNPSQKEGIYGKVHFKNVAIGIIPIDENGFTWLVGQYRYPLNAYSWEIPEGGGKIGVPTLDSAKRELKEETGIIANKWATIQHIHTSNSVSDEGGIIYIAEELSFSTAQPEETEELVIKKVSLKEVLAMILKGEITDSLSLAGIFRLRLERPELFD